MTTELRTPLVACVGEPTPEYLAVKSQWEGFKHTIKINEKWRIEGFITWITMRLELLRCVDRSLPPTPSPDLFRPEVIARMFGIPPEELGCRNSFGKIGKPGRPATTRDLAQFALERRPKFTWKEIATEWKTLHPNDSRNITAEKIKDAYRRAYRL